MNVKSNLGLENIVRAYGFKTSGAIRWDWQMVESHNIITVEGTDSVLKRLASPSATHVTGGGWLEKIGVGDGEDEPNENDTGLKGVNTLEKTIDDGDYTYVRPILLLSVLYGKAEANFNWSEAVLIDNNGDTVARVLISVPFFQPKADLYAGILEWQVRR